MVTAGPPAPPGKPPGAEGPRLVQTSGAQTADAPKNRPANRPANMPANRPVSQHDIQPDDQHGSHRGHRSGSPDARHSPTNPAEPITTDPSNRTVASPFARLVAAGNFRISNTKDSTGPDGNADWHDPDPDAGLLLGEGRTPYDRALSRWTDGVSRDRARTKFRMAKRLLLNDLHTSVGAADMRAYPWHQLTVEDAEDFHQLTYRRYNNQSTRNDYVCAVRAVVVQCYKAGLISALRRELLLEALYTIAPGRSTRRHRITDDEFDQLMDACLSTGTEFARARNSAIIALFRTTGLRVGELVRIDLTDWDQRHNLIHLRTTKNTDPHVVFLHPATKALLLAWLRERGTKAGKLFTAAHAPITRAMAPTSVRDMLDSRCDAASIERFGTHDFRRTFATEMLRTYDAALVSKLLNHRKLGSTLIYDMTSDDEMRNAIGSINLTSRRIGGAA